jgi:quercetin dioxygenase-like cupin family protein
VTKYDPDYFVQWFISVLCGVEDMNRRPPPYVDERLTKTSWMRTFDPSVADSEEYVWHRDHNDRIVTVLEGDGWQFQFDNEIPIRINKNEVIKIPKQVYHRIMVGNTPLKLKIEEVE